MKDHFNISIDGGGLEAMPKIKEILAYWQMAEYDSPMRVWGLIVQVALVVEFLEV